MLHQDFFNKSTAALSFLLNSLNELIVVLNQQGQILFMNKAGLEFYQWSIDVYQDNYSKLCQLQALQVPTLSSNTSSFVHTLTRNNSTQHVLWEIYPFKDGDTDVILLKGTDITEYRKIETDYKNIESRLNSVIEAMPGNYWWKDLEGIYRGYNNNLIRTLGLNTKDDVIGKSDYDLPWKEQAKKLYENDEIVIKSGNPYIAEEDVLTNDGRLLTFRVTKTPLKDYNGNTIGTLGTSVDITDRKLLELNLLTAKEEAENANRFKSQLLSVLGDELRLPLTSILAQAQKLDNVVVLGKKREYAEIIITEASGLKTIIDDIIDFAEGNTAKQYLHQPVLFDLKQFLEDMIIAFQKHASRRGVILKLDYPSGIPNWIHSDKIGWRKVLNYLLAHAIQASDQQEVVIGIERAKQIKRLELDIVVSNRDAPKESPTKLNHAPQDEENTAPILPSLLGIEKISELISLLEGTIHIDYQQNEFFKAVCSFVVDYDHSAPVINYPWSIYQENIKILIVDNSARGAVIREHLGYHNIDKTGTTEQVEIILRAAVALENPYQIVIVGGVHRGELQDGRARRLAKDILNIKDIPLPLLILLCEDDSMEIRNIAEKSGYSAVINPLMGPINLQIMLTAAWEVWDEKNNQPIHDADK